MLKCWLLIDNELKFDEHISNKCLKAIRKSSAFTKLSRFFFLETLMIMGVAREKEYKLVGGDMVWYKER